MATTQDYLQLYPSTIKGHVLSFNWQVCDACLKEKLVFILTRYFPVLTIDVWESSSRACVLTDDSFSSDEIPLFETSHYLIIHVHSRKRYLDLLYFIQALELETFHILMMN